MNLNRFPKLSSSHGDIDSLYDVVVIGSGYGGSIAASRCARAGQKVCLLERGREWHPGDFPESFFEAREHVQLTYQGKKGVVGDPTDLFEFIVGEDLTVLQGCGLGGTSLINANVALDADLRVLQLEDWPKAFRDDLADLTEVDRKHVYDMLCPTEYPTNYPDLPKMGAMSRAAKSLLEKKVTDVEDFDKVLRRLPLYVNFDGSEPNSVGIHQPACNGCGNCCSGCNTGAKNTLNMNYIPDAVAHGAEVFTEVEVSSVQRDSYASLWQVHYHRHIKSKGFELAEQIIRAKYVILGAGALGSTKILLKSRKQGLALSEQLGKQFTGNGDVIGYCYHAQDEMNAVGLESGMYDKVHECAPGPTITSVIDLRPNDHNCLLEGMVIQDGTSPNLLEAPYAVAMAIASKVIGVKRTPTGDAWTKLFEKVKGQALDRTLAFLCMSHDNGEGEISIDEKTGGIKLHWEGVGRQANFEKVNAQLQNVSDALGGTFVRNPMWSESFGKDVVSAHPMGGCVMGDSGQEGVVNHKGQVFVGDSSEVYPGLYVMDGSIIPRSVGVNPTLTIAMAAERCCRLLAKDAGWSVSYDLHKELDVSVFAKPTPGLRFTERMTGTLDLLQADVKEKKPAPCEFTVTVEVEDIERMINIDPDHCGEISGTVTCLALSKEPMSVSEGLFKLFSKSEDIVDAKEMVYKMNLLSVEGKEYFFHGRKIVKRDHVGETGLKDTTTLFIKFFEGQNRDGTFLGDGVLKIKFADFMRQVRTIEITNVRSELSKLKWNVKFSNFFSKALWDTYSGFSDANKFDPEAPPRIQRDLKLMDVTPEVKYFHTEDKVELKFTRYEGGSRGPIIAVAGMAMAGRALAIDTIEENIIEFLVQNGFDVWLLDWRASTDLPWACFLNFSIDDAAKYDFKAAVDKVLQETGEKDVILMAHCISSITMFASLLNGSLEGKVRAVIASQVAATPVGSFANKLRTKLRLPEFMNNIGALNFITAYKHTDRSVSGKMFHSLAKTMADVSLESDEFCASDVCHRLTAICGLLYEHENLNVSTHDTLHEIFGAGSKSYFLHTAKLFRAKKLVSFDGEDIYMPGSDDPNRLNNEAYVTRMKRLDLPICFLHGSQNGVFDSTSVTNTRDLLLELHPNQNYELLEIPDYGHSDVFIGKHASRDVYPKLLSFLDKYAEDNVAKNEEMIKKVQAVLDAIRYMQRKNRAKRGQPLSPIANGAADSNFAIKHMLLKAKEIKRQKAESDDSDDEEKQEIAPELQDVPINKADEIHDRLSEMLPDIKKLVWLRKRKVKNKFHKEKPYVPPEDNEIEHVVVHEVYVGDESKKREIFVISDLHLGGQWSLDIRNRLQEFIETLAKVAEYFCHALVMLGDIFEMWQVPITMSPPSNAELVEKWKNDETIQMFTRAVRKLAEDDAVRVYYVRGNHDHEITEEDVHAMFGKQVQFIPGKLIYAIDNGITKQHIRFEHGHDYDLYNSFTALPKDAPMNGKPFGYYITRATATSTECYLNDTEKVLQGAIRWFITSLPKTLLGSSIIDILGSKRFSRRLAENMLEHAMDRDITGDECVLFGDGQWLRLGELLNYSFVKQISKRYGSSRAFSMLKASLGNYVDFVKEFNEDVVVFAHSHHWKNSVLSGKYGNVHYINSGTWIDLAEHFTYLRMIIPKQKEDGLLEMNYQLTAKSKVPNS